MLEQLKKLAALFLGGVIIVVAVVGFVKYESYQNELARLRNDVAAKDKTTVELRNTYTKLVEENGSLKSSNDDLQKLLDRTKQDLVAEQQLTTYWKGKYTYNLNHTPVPQAPGQFNPPKKQIACTDVPQMYSSIEDIGLLKLTIDTFTVDPSYQQKLTIEAGSKPLRLTLDLTRDKDDQWHTHVVSSDNRIGVDINVNSVNLNPLNEHWYEKLKIHTDMGMGVVGGSLVINQALFGLGASYEFGRYELGPSLWATTNKSVFYGINFSWAPFKTDR